MGAVVLLIDAPASPTSKELTAVSVCAPMVLLGSMPPQQPTLPIGMPSVPTRVSAIVLPVFASATRDTLESLAVVPLAPTTAQDTVLAITSKTFPSLLLEISTSLITQTPSLTLGPMMEPKPGMHLKSKLVFAILTMRELTAPFANALAETTF